MKSGWRTPSRCCRTLTSARALTALSASWRKPSPKWWSYKGRGGFDASETGWYAAQLLDVTRLHQLGWYHAKSHWKRGLPALTSGSLRIKTAFGVMIFTSGRLCHGSALHTTCLSRLLLLRTVAASFLQQKNQPPGAGLLVCAGRARAERRKCWRPHLSG